MMEVQQIIHLDGKQTCIVRIVRMTIICNSNDNKKRTRWEGAGWSVGRWDGGSAGRSASVSVGG